MFYNHFLINTLPWRDPCTEAYPANKNWCTDLNFYVVVWGNLWKNAIQISAISMTTFPHYQKLKWFSRIILINDFVQISSGVQGKPFNNQYWNKRFQIVSLQLVNRCQQSIQQWSHYYEKPITWWLERTNINRCLWTTVGTLLWIPLWRFRAEPVPIDWPRNKAQK